MPMTKRFYGSFSALILAALVYSGPGVNTLHAQTQAGAQTQVGAQAQTGTQMQMGSQAPNPDVPRAQLAGIDQFLDAHPEIAEQVRKNPALINDTKFVSGHPALQQYLQQHPGVREEFTENPNGFMQQEGRFDRRQDNADESAKVRQWQLSTVDQFLNTHPEIAEQVQKNPSLMNDQKFVAAHPALQQYLQQHPGVRQEFQENPNAFMQQEQKFDQREEATDNTKWQMTSADRFFDSHHEIAEQLQKNPSLINDQEFLASHPDLQQYLQQHPGVREDFQENPTAFMQQQQKFDQREGAPTNPQVAGADHFFDAHPEITEQLQKNPALLNNSKFLAQHPALQQYLQQHPGVRQQFQQNPNAFMQQQERFEQHNGTTMADRDAHFGQQTGTLDRDTTRGQATGVGQFLNAHSNIAQEVSKNPALLSNDDYLARHPELQEFLKAHPGAAEEFKENPQAFLNQAQPGTGTFATPKADMTAKPKQK